MSTSSSSVSSAPLFSPSDLLVGLSGADRTLLCTCLALFDDSRWQQRLAHLSDQTREHIKRLGERVEQWRHHDAQGTNLPALSAPDIKAGAQELTQRQRNWHISHYSDDQLRLLLWVRLRTALDLEPALDVSVRGCTPLADDVTAALIHVLDPPGAVRSGQRFLYKKGWLKKDRPALTLDDIVLPVLDELLEASLTGEENAPGDEDRRALLMRSISALDDLGTQDMDRLLQQTEADRYNDAALRNTFLLGGSMGAFGIGVGASGFSAYILAAQASAFIPFVSGSGLVSFVSVLSNPITMLGVAGGGGYWLINSATKRVRAAIAARIAAMLALQSKLSTPLGLERMPDCFACIATLCEHEELAKEGLEKYHQKWRRLGSLYAKAPPAPTEAVLRHAAHPLRAEHPQVGDAAYPKHDATTTELQNATAMAALTLGDALYTLAVIDPHVIAAADFSRLDAIDNEWSFAELAEHVLDSSASAGLGAVSQLKGYVAEQVVATKLVEAGHTVSLPEASNQPGWDLLVDGHPVQVKFHATTAGIAEHFERYTYPVIANDELKGQIPDQWADQVFFIDGLSGELVEQITRDSLTAGAHLLDNDVISMAAIISTARGILAYQKNELTLRQTLEQVLIDSSIRTGLAVGASAAGSGIGFLVFGPAGAVCLGKGAPVLAQMITPNVKTLLNTSIKGAAHHQWEARAHHLVSALMTRLRDALQYKNTVSRQRSESAPSGELGEYLRWRLSDDALFFEECDMHLHAISTSASSPEQRFADTLKVITVCGVHPVNYRSELSAVNEILKDRPGLTQLIDRDRLNTAVADTLTRTRGVGSYLKTLSTDHKDVHDLQEKAKSILKRWHKK